MAMALGLAAQAIGQTSPNPAVGCVIVKDGVVVGRGTHIYAGVDHAETIALREAGKLAHGATVYLTLEPCSHVGRTGPCVDALIAAGIAKVVAAMEDPNPQVRGEGFGKLRAAGIAVEIEPAATAEAERLNEPFGHFMKTGRPLVLLKSAVTLDGKIAAPEDNEGWITSETARAHVQTLRHSFDAICTGIGTVLSDNPRLNDRTGLPRSRPFLRIVLDSQLRLPLHSRLVESAADDVMVVTTVAAPPDRRKALEAHGVEVVALEGKTGRPSLRRLIELLGERRYLSLMIEGGAKVNWSALEAGVVDKIFFYYAPKILGGLQSLPVAGGRGRPRRQDAIRLHGTRIHLIPPDEYAVEAWITKE
jgi:diaminohydroxyphosphoribosylaminopyrimidine deaminase/5-amino-6-(5-phosphoribosylamino)uracil reductase